MLRILIVDDSRTIRKIVRRSLETYGYTALEEAKDGLEAIEHFKSKTFDCVFTDINMPNMDGYELLKWLIKEKLLENLEVIAISTEVAKLGSDEMLALGIDQAIPKPFSKEEFERIAISMLGTIESSRDLKDMPLEYKDEIIVTDDSSSMRGVIKRQLKLYGCHNIYEAENGKVALERINEISMEREDDRKTILFLDLNMPVMDGLELIEVLEQRGLIDTLKIVLLSGSLDMAKSAMDSINIVAALPKPFKQKEFTTAFTPLITDSLLSKTDSFSELKLIDESSEPHDMDSEEFFDYLLSPLYTNIDRFLEYKTLKRIDSRLYSTLESRIYAPIYAKSPFLLNSSQKKLLFSKDALFSLKEKLESFCKSDVKKYFELHYIKNYTPYIELIKKASEQKKALFESSFEEFDKLFHTKLKQAQEDLKDALDSVVYRYDKNFWIGIKRLSYKLDITPSYLNTPSYLEGLDGYKSEIVASLEHLKFHSILCVGFEHKRAQLLKESLENEFNGFDVFLLQNPDISFYHSAFEPNLIIIDYALSPKKIEPFIKATKEKYLLQNDELNILYVLSNKLSSSELSSNMGSCLFDLKLKNYTMIPASQSEYKTLCKKAKTLIS